MDTQYFLLLTTQEFRQLRAFTMWAESWGEGLEKSLLLEFRSNQPSPPSSLLLPISCGDWLAQGICMLSWCLFASTLGTVGPSPRLRQNLPRLKAALDRIRWITVAPSQSNPDKGTCPTSAQTSWSASLSFFLLLFLGHHQKCCWDDIIFREIAAKDGFPSSLLLSHLPSSLSSSFFVIRKISKSAGEQTEKLNEPPGTHQSGNNDHNRVGLIYPPSPTLFVFLFFFFYLSMLRYFKGNLRHQIILSANASVEQTHS